jgi:hypothetical protein
LQAQLALWSYMTYFPQIGLNRISTQHPYTVSASFRTTLNQLGSGVAYGRANRATPLGKFFLNFPALTPAEVSALESFYLNRGGALRPFTLLDPGGNMVLHSEEFLHSSWEKYSVTGGGAVEDPFGGERGSQMQSNSTNGMLATVVLPDGGGHGVQLCASVYARSSAADQELVIGFIDSGFQVLSSVRETLAPNRWTRIWCSTELATDSPVRLLVGGLGSWNGAALQLFGAQCAPLMGPGAYLRSPEFHGLRRNCRFASERLQARYLEAGRVSVKIPIEETGGA